MTIESIENQFNLVAKEYDENRRKFISCFDDYYSTMTDFLANSIDERKNIFDLGSGTGLLASFWFKYFPNANYVLVDIAEEMLEIAKKRFENINNVSFEVCDYSKSLPKNDCDLMLSALSIHHLEYDQKQNLFKSIYEKLDKNGIFVNYDQFCLDDKMINEWTENYWFSKIKESGLSETGYNLWLERKKLDRECSIQQEINWLKNAGFSKVECIFQHSKFGVIVATK